MKTKIHDNGMVATSALLMAVLAVVAAAPVPAADGDRAPAQARPMHLAAVKVFPSAIDLAPRVRYERATVTVSGVGRTFFLEFDAATSPTIEPFDASGELLADGVYKWELKLVPDAATAGRLRASAGANGGEAERPWRPQTGTFAVAGGMIVSPEVIEPGVAERLGRAEAERAGGRAEVAAQSFGGQIFGGEKNLAGRAAAAVDTDEAAAGGGDSEISIFKASRTAAARESARRDAGRSTQTGPDSDRQAAELGASLEKPLVAIPKAHEIEQQNQRPRADGSNGRPRSDR